MFSSEVGSVDESSCSVNVEADQSKHNEITIFEAPARSSCVASEGVRNITLVNTVAL